jgi:hydroxymethylbilane synthase
MALFCRCRIRKNQLKASKLYQFRLDDSCPAQGAMLVVAMQKDSFAVDALSHLNDIETEIVTYISSVSKTLEGGCTAPIEL